MGNSPNIKGTTMLSTAIIKIIAKIYNHPIKTADCLDLIESKKYTNELKGNDTYRRKIEKSFCSVFYKNGPAAREVEYLSEYVIKEYNNELRLDRIFYEFLNEYKDGINLAIECLNEIND